MLIIQIVYPDGQLAFIGQTGWPTANEGRAMRFRHPDAVNACIKRIREKRPDLKFEFLQRGKP